MTPLVLAWPDIVYDLQSFIEDRAEVFIVGGAVRDAYLRRPVKDIDLIVPDYGAKLARQIANHFSGAYYPLDVERDIGRAILNTPDGRIIIDASCFRGSDLMADLADRDFTINAVAVPLRGSLNSVIDPLEGISDLRDKVLRRCGPQSIAADPVRALRAVRFGAQLGFRILPETLADIRASAEKLGQISPERIRDEWFRILALPKAASALRVMKALNLLEPIMPTLSSMPHAGWESLLRVIDSLYDIITAFSPLRTDETVAQFRLGALVSVLDRYRPELEAHLSFQWPDERPHRALLALALLLRAASMFDLPISTSEYGRRLPLSTDEIKRIQALVHPSDLLRQRQPLTPIDRYRFWKTYGRAGVDEILINLADYATSVETAFSHDEWLRRIERAGLLLDAWFVETARYVEPTPLITGDTLIEVLGMHPGPAVGRLLEMLREAQVEGTVKTVDEALAFARRWLSKNGRFQET
ncbi:MAG: hypothetical protein SNJ59_01465 [Aggregatilineales bacterium]